jgi:hypothetical protein
MRNMPFAAFEHNRARLELSLVGQEMLCFARSLCLRRAFPRRAQAASPAPPSCRRSPGALGPAHNSSPVMQLALGRRSRSGLRAAAGAARRCGAIARRRAVISLTPANYTSGGE